MSALDQIADIASPLFNHYVGTGQQSGRDGEAERLGGLEIDHQLELRWGLHGKRARIPAAQDATDISRRKSKLIALLRSVAKQATEVQRKNGTDRRQAIGSEQPSG